MALCEAKITKNVILRSRLTSLSYKKGLKFSFGKLEIFFGQKYAQFQFHMIAGYTSIQRIYKDLIAEYTEDSVLFLEDKNLMLGFRNKESLLQEG